MSNNDRIELDGVVIDSNNGRFRVKITDDHIVLATLSGKIRINNVKILLGDYVKVEVSPFDLHQGRIIFRIKGS